MKTLEEAWHIIEALNGDAHDQAYDTWAAADELSESDDEDDWETAEVMREEASLEQAGYFREYYDDLDNEERSAIEHWLQNDEDFKEQFAVYYGEEEFKNEFGDTHE
jgi:hypothetical protein